MRVSISSDVALASFFTRKASIYGLESINELFTAYDVRDYAEKLIKYDNAYLNFSENVLNNRLKTEWFSIFEYKDQGVKNRGLFKFRKPASEFKDIKDLTIYILKYTNGIAYELGPRWWEKLHLI